MGSIEDKPCKSSVNDSVEVIVVQGRSKDGTFLTHNMLGYLFSFLFTELVLRLLRSAGKFFWGATTIRKNNNNIINR